MNTEKAKDAFKKDLFDNHDRIREDTVKKCIKRFEANYELDDKTVRAVFDAFPNNNKEEEVLAKVIVLNNRYSAGLTDTAPSTKNIDVKSVARRIVGMEERIKGCSNAEDAKDVLIEMSKIEKNYIKEEGLEKESYTALSFASKYCAWTWKGKPCEPRIYDSYVTGMLYYINRIEEYRYKGVFTQDKIRQYSEYCAVYDCFTKKYQLRDMRYNGQKLSEKQIDEFLWQFAKDHGIHI